MSLLFNARRTKCLKIIFPVVKHISTNNNKQAIALPNAAKPSLLTPIRYFWSNHTNATKSIIFGFSLLGLFRVEDNDANRQLTDTIKKGMLYLQNGDYNAFEQTLHEALKIANDLQNVDGVTHVYDVLANGALKNKEYEKAKDLFNKLIKRLYDQGYMKNDLNILQLRLNISKIYEVQKNYNYSEIGYIFCIKHLEKRMEADPENKEILYLYVKTLDTYARYLTKQGQIKEAKHWIRKAYRLSVKLNGEICKKNVVLLNFLGSLSYTQGNINRALYYFTKAESIGQHLPDMKIHSILYTNLGKVYLLKGVFAKAEKNCIEGLKCAKRHCYFKGKKEAEICLAKITHAMKQKRTVKKGE